MTCHSCAAEMVAYLESLQRGLREQETKTAQRIELAYAETPAELAGGWMLTESGTGRLATGGKAPADSPGKIRTTSAPADVYRVQKDYRPSQTYKRDIMSAKTKRSLFDVNIPDPNETIFSKILPFKRKIYSAASCDNRSVNGPRIPPNFTVVPNFDPMKHYPEFGTIVKPHFKIIPKPSQNESENDNEGKDNYRKENQDRLKAFMNAYMEKSAANTKK